MIVTRGLGRPRQGGLVTLGLGVAVASTAIVAASAVPAQGVATVSALGATIGGSIAIPASGVATVSAVGAVVISISLVPASGSSSVSATSSAVVPASASISNGSSTTLATGGSISACIGASEGSGSASATCASTASAAASGASGASACSALFTILPNSFPIPASGSSSVSAQIDRVLAFAVSGASGVSFALAIGAYGRPTIWSGGIEVTEPDGDVEVIKGDPVQVQVVKLDTAITVINSPTDHVVYSTERTSNVVKRHVESVIVKSRVTNDLESTSSRTTRVVVVQDGVKRVKASSDS